MKTNRTANAHSKQKSTAHSQRLVLESRLVFDGAMVATVAEAQPDTVDNKPMTENTSAAATPPSEPPVDFTAEKTPPVVDYHPDVQSIDNQPAFPVEPSPLDVKDLPAAPVVGVSGEYASIVIVVDPRVNNAADLMAHPPANTQIMMLDTTRDGFQQVAQLLQGRHDVTELHVLPWTQDNAQWLGNKTLSATLEPSVSDALTHWGDGFADNANIVFHGVNNPSTSWLNHIDALTGADTHWLQDVNLPADLGTKVHELVVVDTSIENYQSLLNDVNPDAEILYIDPSKDGIQQIVEGLQGRTDISTLHILSHGSQGSLILGTSVLNGDSLEQYKTQLAEIGQSLSNNGDILFYGCNVADGTAGLAFIGHIADITKADIAASNDVTGNAAKGGDWNLESTVGVIESAYLTLNGYDGLLAAPVIANTTAGQPVNDTGSNTPFAAVAITDADVGNLQTLTVTLDTAAKGTLSNLSGGTFVAGVYTLSGVNAATAQAAIRALVFTPTANRVAPTLTETTTFTISVNDGTTTVTNNATTVISTSINDVPVAIVDSNTIVEKSVNVIGNVLTNDTDADTGDTKTVSALTGGTVGISMVGTYGSLLLNADGSYTYTLDNTNTAVQGLSTSSAPLTESFTYTMRDTANATSSSTLSMSISGVNDQPTITATSIVLTQAEDVTQVFNVSSLLNNVSNAPIWSDNDTGTVMGVAITDAPSVSASGMTGTWYYSLDAGANWTVFPAVSASNALLLDSSAQVKFIANHDNQIDSKNSGTLSLTYTAWDTSSGIVGGMGNTTAPTSTSPFSTASNTATFNVTPSNDPPTFASTPVIVNEHSFVNLTGGFSNDSAAILTGNLQIHDVDNTTAQILYRIEELPTKGTLTLNGATLAVGSLFSQSNIASIRYTPNAGELSADTSDRFYFTIRDGAGGVIGSDGKTGANPWAFLDVTIKDVNAPVSVSGTTVSIAEDNANPGVAVIAPINLSMSDGDDPSNLRTLTLTSLPTATFGTLEYWNGSSYQTATVGLTFTQAQLTDPVNPALRFVYNNNTEPTDVNGALIPAQSQTSFTVSAEDNNPLLPETTANATVTINILPVNDVPVLTTSDLTVVQNSSNNAIGTTNLTTTDPDSPVNQRTYTLSVDANRGYLTLNGVRIGRGSTFTEAQLTSGQLKYTTNDPYYYGPDSIQVYVTDGDGGQSNDGTININITQNIVLPPPPINTNTPADGSGNSVSVTGTLQAVSPESLFFKLDNVIISGTGTLVPVSYSIDSKPSHGDVYLNGVKVTYGVPGVGTAFSQADINAGKVIYLHDGSEPDTYGTPYLDPITITAVSGTAILTQNITVTITPVDDAPTISQTVASYNTNEVGGALMEQNADGSNGLATANFALSNVTNAKKLTSANFTDHDIDNTQSQLTYIVSTVGGSVARWNGSNWVVVTQFSPADLIAGNIAYFHDPAADVVNPNDTTMTGSVTVYLIDGAVVGAGDVVIAPPNITEQGTLTVTDGASSISLAKEVQMRSPSRTVTFTITDVNDAPIASNTNFTVTEFSAGIVGQTDHIQILNTSIVAVTDSDTANSTWTYSLTALPSHGKIQKFNGSAWIDMAVNDTFTYADLAGSKLRYVNSGLIEVTLGLLWTDPRDSFKFITNDGELISNPKPLDSNEATVSIYLRPTNQPPVVVNNGPTTVVEGGARRITGALLGSADAPNDADIVKAVDPDHSRVQVQYRITNNVDHGIIYLGDPASGVPSKQLSVGSAITLEDIQLGRVWYQHDGSEAALYGNQDSFDYAISDASGMNEPTATFVITLIPVNDAPVVTGLVGGATFVEGGTNAVPNVTPILIDSNVTLSDPDLANNVADFRTGSLTISNTFASKTFDQLSIKNTGNGAGQIGYNPATGVVSYGGVQIGTVNTAGTANGVNGNDLTISFTAGANPSLTLSAIKTLIESITFLHSEYDNAITGTRTLNYTLVDGGGTDSYVDDRARTFTGTDTWTGNATVIVAPANDRPILSTNTSGGDLNLGTITEDDTTTPTTFQVSSFTTAVNGAADGTHTGIADTDTGAVRGIAITSLVNAATGHWEYSANGVNGWTTITGVSATNALLLAATDYIRFIPDGKNGGTAKVTYLAWDTTSGSARTYVNPTINNTQTSAFSVAADTAALTVTSINDAPIGINNGTVINSVEDVVFPAQSSINALTGFNFQDVDTGATFNGVAIIGNTANAVTEGVWQYSTGANIWAAIGTVSNASSLVLSPTTQVRFMPAPNYNGTPPSLTVRTLDNTYGGSFSISTGGETRVNLDSTVNGATTAISALTNTIGTTITPINDTPTITVDKTISTPVNEGAAVVISNALESFVVVDDIEAARNEGTGINQGKVSVTITVPNGLTHGKVTLGSVAGIVITAGANDSNTVTIRGTLTDVNNALNGLSFTPGVDTNTSETVTVTINDLGNNGTGTTTALTALQTITINNILPSNNAPTVTAPATVIATEDTAYTFSGGVISIADVDVRTNDIVELTLNLSSAGTFRFSTATGLFTDAAATIPYVLANQAAGANVVVYGTITNLNAALNGLIYTPASNLNSVNIGTDYIGGAFAGHVHLDITVNDRGYGDAGVQGVPLSATTMVDITVNPVNDAPSIVPPSASSSYTEQAAAVTIGAGVTVTDAIDDTELSGATVTIDATNFRTGDTLDAPILVGGITASYNAGTRTLTLSGVASIADYNTVLQAVTFSNLTNEAPTSGGATTRTITWQATDNNADSAANGVQLSSAVTSTINIAAVNDPADITANNVTVNEGASTLILDATNANIIVADSDDDGAATLSATVTVDKGFITAVGGAGGTVTGVGASSQSITITGATEAQLNSRLKAITLTFPNEAGPPTTANWNGLINVTVAVNDGGNTGSRPSSLIGDTNNPNANPGDYSYADGVSAQLVTTRAFTVTVNPVNNEPTRTDATPVTLLAVNEDVIGGVGNTPPGDTVSNLFGSKFSDALDGITGGSSPNTFAGIAITTNAAIAAQGIWQYSSDGNTWTNLPAVASTTALLLKNTDYLRFVPAADFHGTPGSLTARLADNSGGAIVTGTTTDVTIASTSTPYSNSSDSVTLNTTVTNVNDRPTGTATTLLAVNEDAANPTGAVLSTLGFGYSDARDNQTAITGGGNAATAFGGIAIVGNAADSATQGVWQYDVGSGWVTIGNTVSDTAALLLPSTAAIRFLPNVANYNGTPGSLTTYVSDTAVAFNASSDISGTLGITSQWSTAIPLGTTVTPLNDAPVLTATASSPSVTENATTATGLSVDPVALFNAGASVSDIDLTTTAALTSTVFGAGSITVSFTDAYVTGDVLFVDPVILPVLPVGVTVTGGTANALTITLATTTTVAEVNSLLAAISYKSTSDNPTVNDTDNSRAYQIVISDGNNRQGAVNPNAGGPTALNSNIINGTLTITRTNDAPVVDLNGVVAGFDNAVTWTEGANVAHTPIAIAPNATVTDTDNTNMTQLVMQVGGVLDGNSEVLNIGGTVFQLGTTVSNVDIGSFLVSFDSVTKIFSIVPDGTSIALATSFQTLIQGITYINNTDNPTDGDRTVTFNITDAGYDNGVLVAGELGSNTPTATINANPVNDQPVITGLNAVTYFENAINATAAIIDGSVTLTDIDSPNYDTGTLIVSGLVAGQDTVSLPVGAATVLGNVQINGGNVEYYDGSSWVVIGTQSGGVGANFIVTFNANATAAIVQRVIENLTFANSSDNPTLTRTLTIAVNDGDGGAVQNATVGVTIKLDNDAPVMSATVLGGTYTEQNATPLQFVGGVINVSDPDSPANFYINVAAVAGSLTVALDTYVAGDTLSVLHQGTGAGQIGVSGATISYGNVAFATTSGGNGVPLVITFTSSTATPAAVQALLAQLAYSNTTSVDPTVNNTDSSRVFTVTLNDGGNTKDITSATTALTATLTGTINLTAINSSPVITPLVGAAAYTENAVAVVVDNTVTVSDVDDTQIAGGTISITGNFLAGDVLAVTNTGNITGSYNAGTGVLTLSGTDTLANYQAVLRSLSYLNSTDDPTDNTTKTTRTLTYSLTDANSDAVGAAIGTATKTINITPLQDAPVLTGGTTLTYTEQAPAAVIDNTVTVASDADDTLMSSATVTLSSGFTTGDVLGFINQLGITGSYNSVTGVLTLTGNATLADYTTALRSVTFNSTSDVPTIISASRTVSWQVRDANSDLAGIASSNTVTSTINILAINDTPIFTALGNSVNFTELGSAVVLNNAVTISDVDLNPLNSGTGNYNGTTLTLARNGGANAEDVFSNTGTLAALTQGGNLTVGATIIGTVTTNSAGTLVLTFNANATTALVNSTLQQIAYRNNSSTPLASVQIDWLFNDQDPNITGGGIAGTGQDQGGGGLLTASGFTTINIDRLPTANADTNSIAENTATVAGNVITGATTADDQGDPVTTVTGVALGTQASTSGSVSTPIAGSYGSLTLNADGSYTYTLDNTNPTVNALLNGQTLLETYSYTITDVDGDASTTTLKITINGTTDNIPSIIPVDGNAAATGHTTVQESGLTSLADTTETNTGTITLSALDGLASINVGGTSVTLAQLNNLGTTPISIVTPKGTITLTAYNSTSNVGGVSTGGTLSYSYTLTQVQNTPAATENTDNIALSITNAGGNTVTDTLTIQIIDDVPTANADTNSVAEGTTTVATTTTGNVFASGSAGDVSDRIGADVTVTPVSAFSFGANNGTVGSPLNGAYGSLTLNANGSYTYSLNNTNPAVNALLTGDTLLETFNYTITDADGDTSSTTLIITINGTTDGVPSIIPVDGNAAATGHTTVQESGLTSGADTSETNTGAITLTAQDGLASINVGGTLVTLADLNNLGTTPITIVTPKGAITLTSYNSTSNIGGVSTAGTLNYSYTLTQVQNTPAATENTDDIVLSITNAGGNTVNNTLTVRIVDDVPTANADTNSVAEGTTAAATTTTGNVFAAVSAGDVSDRIGADVPVNPVTAFSFGASNGTVGNPLNGAYGSLTLNADGSYTYSLDNTNPTVNALLNTQTLTETYSYTITDADGDTSSTTLIITINGTTDNIPSIIPDDGNAGATGQTTVQESGLTSLVDTTETNTGTITLSALDGLASINVGGTVVTLADLNNLVTTPITIVTPKGTITLTGYNSTSSVGGVSTGGTLSYSYTLTQVQNTPAATENTDNIALSITNAGGNTVTDTLIIQIVDDTPTANPDTNSVDEGVTTAATTTTGNVFAAGSAGDAVDRIGADVPANPVTAFSFGANKGTVGNPLNGAYGSLTLNANGSYSYSLDNTNPAVNALLTGDTLLETFSYTITDADGDISTTTLTITINGITDSSPEITPIDGNDVEIGQATVFEKGLVTPSDKSQTTTGTITVATPDGMASVTIGGTTFTVAELAGFTVGTPSANIDTGEGTLIVTGFNIAAGPAVAPTAGTLSYSYTLKTAQTHIGEKIDNIALVVTDASSASNTATSTLNIRIVDDTPTANADANTVIEGTTILPTTTSGNVFGKTGAAATDVADRIGADTTVTPVTAVSFGGNIKTVGTPFNSSYGSLLLNADGSYTYTLDNTNTTVNALSTGQSLTETFSYTITDADGDTSTTNLVITIKGRNDAPIAVNDNQIGVSGQPVIINVLGNDSDPENDINPATVKIVGTAKAGDSLVVDGQGTWSVNPITGAITFTPIAGFTDDPTPIRYTVKDKTGLESNPATVTVDYPQNPPIAVNDNATANTGQAVTINIIDNDSDAENDLDPATVKIAGTANAGDSLVVDGQGTWSVNLTTGEITFKPMIGFTDDPTPIRYTVKDRTGLESNPATVRVDYPEVINNSLTSGSLILLSNPDRTALLSSYNEFERKNWNIEYKFKLDNSLPPEHLSLYVPLARYVLSLTGSLRDQVVLELERYSFSVPRWMFRHTDPNEQLEFEAKRPDGSSLPDWLRFNAENLRFSGIPPRGAHNERVMVIARDTYGNEVRATFNVRVNKECARYGYDKKTCEEKNKIFNKQKFIEKPVVGKSGLSEQVHAVGKLSKLQESRALLDSLKQLKF